MMTKREISIFLFSWINSFKRSFPVFIKYFWWLILLEIAVKNRIFTIYSGHKSAILVLISILSLYFSVLSIRSSIGIKNIFYFIRNTVKLVGCASIALLFMVTYSIANLTAIAYRIKLLYPIFPLALFFLLDKQSYQIIPHRSLHDSVKQFFLAFPIFLLISIPYFIISSLIPNYLLSVIGITINFFFICPIGVLYIRLKHNRNALTLSSN